MTPHLTRPCSCGLLRLAYGQTVLVDEAGDTHRGAYCTLRAVVVAETLAPPTVPWRLLATTCAHGLSLWSTGPEPEALLAALGCGCGEDAA